MPSALTFDPLAQTFSRNANAVFTTMRAHAPVYKHGNAQWPLISIFKYTDIKSSLMDYVGWSSNIPAVAALVLGDAAVLIQDDPPRHTRYKRLIGPYLTPGGLGEVGIDIAETARKLFNRIIDQDVDFIEEFAAKFSTQVIQELVGIPVEDRAYIRDWTNRLSRNVGREFIETNESLLDDQAKRVRVLHEELTDYFIALSRSEAIRSTKTLLGELLDAGLTLTESVGLAKSISFAGNHTSTILQGNAVWLFATNPSQLKLLQQKGDLVAGAADEVLRCRGAFRVVNRIATRAGEISGIRYEPGEYLMAWLSSGNWDEEIFTHPQEFKISREAPHRHLAFGAGPHFCIGQHVARLELEALLTLMRERVKQIDLTGTPAIIHDPWVDGFEELKVRLT